jgi:hypothetical protein
MTETRMKLWRGFNAVLMLAIAAVLFGLPAAAQDDYQDDPPDRVARLGYIEGSVSMQPAGESEWVGAVPNRPLTIGDKIWADQDSRAELNLGSAVIRLAPNTGFSFLNLDDRTVQIELTSGSINVRVRRLDRNDVFEIDTPNQAFTVFQPGNYRVDASEDGTYTVVSVRNGEGESTGNGQTFTLHSGQQGTFSGTDYLNADVIDIGGTDQFDSWAETRDRRYEGSRSARYVSPDVVGYEDLDDYGDWRDDSNYGHVWYPSRVESGWAPYQTGHWDWISPWGWTWVDDAPWGYAPFHYGRWVTVGGRWGWVSGPPAVRAVYAPALVVFIGGGGGFGGNVGWFPLGPREVYVPSYRVSRGYVERVNVSNTNVNVTNVTNVYNTTIVNKTTNITNVTYVNRGVRGAVTAVPQRSFVSAQPVARAKVAINERDITSAQLTTRVAVAPTRESVLGARANTANHVTAPPENIRNRPVVAKRPPPPPPVPFERQQAELQKNPGQPLARREVQSLRPASAPEARPTVKVAPPGKPSTPNNVRPPSQPNQPGGQRAGRPDQPNRPNADRPGANNSQPNGNPNAPENRPGNQPRPNDHPDAANPAANRPGNNQPGQPGNRPEQPNPAERPNNPNARPDQPNANDRPNNPKPNERPERPNQNQNNARPNDARPNDARPNDTRPNDSRPNNARPNDARPNDTQPNARPDRTNQNDAKPNETKPNDARPNTRPEDPNRNDHPNRPDRPNDAKPDNRPAQPNNAAQPNNDRAPNGRPEARPNDRQNDRPNARPDPPAANDRQPPDAKPNAQPDRPNRNDRPADARPNGQPTPRPDRTDRPPQQQRPETPEERQQRQKQEREQKKQEEKPPNS